MNPIVSLIRVLLGLACLSVFAESRAQEDFALSGLSIHPPLAAMNGADFALEAPRIGEGEKSLQGADYRLAVAITELPSIITIGATAVFVVMDGANVVVTWGPAGGGFILESSPSVGASANWRPVDPAIQETRFVAPIRAGSQYFRLRHP